MIDKSKGTYLSSNWLEPLVSYYKIYFGDTAENIFDVGTRDGDDAQFLKQMLNAKNIYAVEARPEAAQLTREKYPDFIVFETAISDFSGETEFYEIVSDDADYVGSSSIYNNKFERPEYPHKIIRLPVITMNDLIENNNLSSTIFDIVKVDIEGFTYQLLCGMHRYIKNVKMFHLETEKWSTHTTHRNSIEIANIMRSHGFKLVGKQYQWGEDIEDQIWINGDLCPKS